MARGGTAHVTHPNVIRLHFDCECRQVDISRLLGASVIFVNENENENGEKR